MKRHCVIVFDRRFEKVEKVYVTALDAGYAVECALEHYRKLGWTPSVIYCILSKFTDEDFSYGEAVETIQQAPGN
jgi:hypothetical protein